MSMSSPVFLMDLSRPPQPRMVVGPTNLFSGVQQFQLKDLWAMHLYDYEATWRIDGHELAIRPRSVTLTPPAMVVEYDWPRPSSHSCAHVGLGHAEAGEGQLAPALTQLSPRVWKAFSNDFAVAANAWQSGQAARAQAKLWEMLWQLVRPQPQPRDEGPLHPAVHDAVSLVERRLHEPLRVADIAEAVELSHNQLTRLFREAFGVTVVAYLRQRRAERAHHLLTRTTMPIKAIAYEVGLGDLQQFNKLIRRELGDSPTAVREAG